MAKYIVTPSQTDDWSSGVDGRRQFDTRPPADEYFDHEVAMGRFVRLICWDKEVPQVLRVAPYPPMPEPSTQSYATTAFCDRRIVVLGVCR
jgi:hypothetical protein